MSPLDRFAPGLAEPSRYRPSDAPFDFRAGLAVATVAVPVGIAYAELAGFPPQVGLYSSLFPLVAYAVFGSSRQLIVGPDAATCAVIAAAVTPLAAGDPAAYLSLSAMLALLTGLICIGASFLRLGALADFLSKPILVGFLNGVALSIILGQAGKIFGFAVTETGFLPRIAEIASKLGEIHGPTLAVALGTFAVMAAVARLAPTLPSALAGMALAGLAVPLLGLAEVGVKTIGAIPAGLPAFAFPSADAAQLPALLAAAAGLALVSFSSLVLTAQSFASKNGYEIEPDKDFAALGAANVASALTQGFAISGADSRTAMSDAAGGRTHAVGLVAADSHSSRPHVLYGPIRYVPVAALGAVLVMAGLLAGRYPKPSPALSHRPDGGVSVCACHARCRGCRGRQCDPARRRAVSVALDPAAVAAASRDVGQSRGLPRLAFPRAARRRTANSRPAAVSLQCSDYVLQRVLLQKELMREVDEAGPGLRHVVIGFASRQQHRRDRDLDHCVIW